MTYFTFQNDLYRTDGVKAYRWIKASSRWQKGGYEVRLYNDEFKAAAAAAAAEPPADHPCRATAAL